MSQTISTSKLMPTTLTNNQNFDHQVLEPTLLGRPVHLLPRFAARLGDALAGAMQSSAWRRSWDAFRVAEVEFGPVPHGASLRWLAMPGPFGTVGVAFERRLQLGLLNCRYGRRGAPVVPQHDLATERVTATEQRFAATLTQQLAGLLNECVGVGAGQAGAALPTPAATPGKAAWAIRIVLREAQSGAQGQCWLAPDLDLMTAILKGLRSDKPRARLAGEGVPLASGLQVRLDARLLSKEIPLGALFAMKVGDVIPVSVGRADVLLDESRLFTAAVAENKGKLCLTSFEDAE
jgi:flagellar motor switch protein FliM